jgi:simple sugar transport system ATP-binding protein
MSTAPSPAPRRNDRLPVDSGSDALHMRPRRIEPVAPDVIPVIEAVKVSKAFGATAALVDVSLKAYERRILALLGDNGAGKSTLIKILSGVFPPDTGELRFRGERVTFTNPAQARQLGIATVFQDLAVCELLSVTRNVVLGREPQNGIGPFKLFDLKRADEMARSALHRLGVRWERGLDERGVNLSGGERQSLAIARAMFFGSSLLVLDEPTSALAVRQAGRVLDHLAQARDQGQAVILITHNFRHALSVADDLTVLAQGRVAAHFRRDEIELDELTSTRRRPRNGRCRPRKTSEGAKVEAVPATRHRLALACREAGDLGQARTQLGMAVAETSDPEAAIDLARVERELGDLAGAKRTLADVERRLAGASLNEQRRNWCYLADPGARLPRHGRARRR